jgi:hypothetical protein
MALSPAMQWALANGLSEADVYKNINDFLATNPDAATTQAQMAQYGISGEDIANATGGKSGGLLSGNIMAGASWNSTNTALQNALTEATGQQTANYAVGGSTTSDTLNQLNTYLAGGGQFDPNATVYLQAGGVDFIQGVDKEVVKDNLNQIVKTLGDQGVNVVLTGSPYATSVQDVIDNKFNPEVDPIYKDVAKANSNVALVNTQGEILQNKDLLVDALHTNAEGTAIYNQSVIDALSQFKNEVPASTPTVIAQAQKSNVIPTARGTVIEGDNIEEQIAGVPQVVYETRVDPNNTANWETYNPKTGEVIDSGTFAGGGDKGLLRAAAPVIGLAASTVGLPFISNLIGGATGLTGSALSGATGAAIGGGTQAVTGGSTQDVLRGALLGGGAGYLGKELNNYIASRDVPVDFTNMTPEQIADATETNFINDLKRAGLTNAQIDDFITNAGGSVATPVAVSTPVTDSGTVSVTAPTTPSLSNVIGTIASTTPTVSVAAPKATQNVDQSVIDMVNSQIAANVKNPSNLANLEVTGNRPATVQEVVNAITATLPALTSTQAQTVAEQVVTGNRPVTTQEVINAITATLPTTTAATTSTVPTQTITAQAPTKVGDTLATLPSTLVSTPASTATTTTKETDPIKVAQLALAAAGLLGAGSALSNDGTKTGFDVVPVPESWKTPPRPSVAPATQLPPIDFGNRNLLIGTQWEKFLDPNYGKVPAPVQYSQPSNLSYNDLMGILGSKQGMPPASSLSINDIISGVQNQYGQAPARTMG